MFHRRGLLPGDRLLSSFFRGRSGVAGSTRLFIVRFCDMLPFKQPRVHLFGTCCSLAEDPEAFMILICFPLCPPALALQRGEAVDEVQWAEVTPLSLESQSFTRWGDAFFHTPLSTSCIPSTTTPTSYRILTPRGCGATVRPHQNCDH